jgi:hypothetical protein
LVVLGVVDMRQLLLKCHPLLGAKLTNDGSTPIHLVVFQPRLMKLTGGLNRRIRFELYSV